MSIIICFSIIERFEIPGAKIVQIGLNIKTEVGRILLGLAVNLRCRRQICDWGKKVGNWRMLFVVDVE